MRRALLLVTLICGLILAACNAAKSAGPAATSSPAAADTSQQPLAAPDPRTSTDPIAQNIRFEQFGLEQGLSQSTVNSILQDRVGFLWVGTQDGLNRYDGYNFKVYKPDAADAFSVSDRWITALAQDTHGFLWVGTRLGGLNRYDPRTGLFTHFMHDAANFETISNNHISSLFADTDGLWIGTENGLDFLTYDTAKITHLRGSAGAGSALSSNLITCVFKDSSGNVWVGTYSAGLNIYNPATDVFKSYRFDEGDASTLSHNRVLSIEQDAAGRIWIGTDSGLNRFEPSTNSFTRFVNAPDDSASIAGNSVYAIYSDRSGGLWIGTNNGLDLLEPKTNRFFHHTHQPPVSNSLGNNHVLAIFEDHDNVLWVGTFGGGLNKYNRQQDQFAYYRNDPADANSVGSNFIAPMLADRGGDVWIGTRGAGLDRFDPRTNQFTHFRHNDADATTISGNDILSLAEDRAGRLWIGTDHGLDEFAAGTSSFTHFLESSAAPGHLTSVPVTALYADRGDNLWVGTARGLDLFNPISRSFAAFELDQVVAVSLSGQQVTSILEDASGTLWVGTFDDGLKLINTQEGMVSQYKNDPEQPDSIGSDSITCLYRAKNDAVWICTAGGGLERYNAASGRFTHFTEKDGLANNVTYGILEDHAGRLWISTNFGISRYDPQARSVRNFNASDGLQSNEFNQDAFASDRDGRFYFGGVNGFNSFLPDEIRNDPTLPPVALTSITADGKNLKDPQTAETLHLLTLAWPSNSFEFEFSAFSFGQPGKNQYSYKLAGFDKDWNVIGSKRNGRYTNLPGGTYTLYLRGSNADGVWNDHGQAVQITVVPPLWNTWGFRLASLTALVSVVAIGLRLRVHAIESRNRELERVVQARTADLEKRTGEIEALYQADERIFRNVSLDQVYQTLVDVSVSMLKADRSVVFAWSDEIGKIMPRVSRGFQPETLRVLNFELNEGMVGKAMSSGLPIVVPDLKLEELRGDIQEVIRQEGIQSFAHFPIVADGGVLAIFNVGYTRPNALNEDTLRLFHALVNRAQLSIANMELFEVTKDLAVMEERNRLARDLHDSAKQKAFAALAQLGTANGMWKKAFEDIQPHISEAETLIYEVIQELTFLVQEIYPMALQDQGLPNTLREYIFEWENRNDVVVDVTVRNARPLPLETEQAVYRVIQETLANIARHSHAKRAAISLVYDSDALQVTIADDGCGFEMDQKTKGVGLRSMRERIDSVHGTIQVQSAPGQGTRVIVQLPIKTLAGEQRA